jgi:5-formyltetrahydrofolate cyclo-ligase
MEHPTAEKKLLRKKMRTLRDAAAPEQRAKWSVSIARYVRLHPAYQQAHVVHVFLSIQSEIDTRPIIEDAFRQGKRVVIPVFALKSNETANCEIDTLADSAYDIGGFGLRVPRVMRPVDPALIDVVLIPLLAFAPASGDSRWLRLGYGAGFYDTFLSRVQAAKVGIAFSMQRVAQLPREPHDILLDDVITEDGLATIAQNVWHQP